MHWDGERNFLFQGLLRLPIPPLPFYLRRRCWISWDGERTRRRERGRENEAEKKWVLVWPPAAAAAAAAISGVEWQRSCRSPVFYETDPIELSLGPTIRRRFRSDFGGSVAAAATVATTTADRDREWPSLSSPSRSPSSPAFIRACLAVSSGKD